MAGADRPPKPTKGSRALSESLQHGTMGEFAKLLGVNPQTLSRWASGHRKPPLDMLLRISELKSIPVEDWAVRVYVTESVSTEAPPDAVV